MLLNQQLQLHDVFFLLSILIFQIAYSKKISKSIAVCSINAYAEQRLIYMMILQIVIIMIFSLCSCDMNKRDVMYAVRYAVVSIELKRVQMLQAIHILNVVLQHSIQNDVIITKSIFFFTRFSTFPFSFDRILQNNWQKKNKKPT